MSKKILSITLALCLALSCFAVSAFALGAYSYEEFVKDAEGNPTEEIVGGYTQSWDLGTPANPSGTTWEVPVTLTANYKVGAFEFTIENTDNVNAVLTGFTPNAVDETTNPDGVIPASWEVDAEVDNDTGRVIINANPSTDDVEPIDCTAGITIGTLTFDVVDGKSADIKIKNDPKTAATPGGTLIAARIDDGNVVTGTYVVGQIVAGTGSTQTIGKAAVAADPVLTGVNGGVVNETKKYVYGIPKGSNADAIKTLFTVENGTFDVAINSKGTYGTGATLTVYNANGEVFDTYTIIITGDTNGDNAISSSDVTGVTWQSVGTYFSEDMYIFAADMNLDGNVSSSDVTLVTWASVS